MKTSSSAKDYVMKQVYDALSRCGYPSVLCSDVRISSNTSIIEPGHRNPYIVTIFPLGDSRADIVGKMLSIDQEKHRQFTVKMCPVVESRFKCVLLSGTVCII